MGKLEGPMSQFTLGPARYFVPVSSKGPLGYTFHGPMGYEEVPAEDVGERPIEPRTEQTHESS